MNTDKALEYLEQEIHSVIMATVDDKGLPVTCAVDIMDSDEKGLYFLTAKGKDFYGRLTKSGYIALTGIKGRDTLSCISISICGRVREVGNTSLERLFAKNQYMYEIYPTEQSRQALTVFVYTRAAASGLTFQKSRLSESSLQLGICRKKHAGL